MTIKKIKFPSQPTMWFCPVCYKWDTPGGGNPDLAPEHYSIRGVDVGDCKGQMLSLYTKKDVREYNESKNH